MNLASLLLTHAKSRKDHPAIETDDGIIGYAEAARIVAQYAARLSAEGVVEGDRVGLALPDTADHLLLHFAVAWLGATIVPIDYRWRVSEKAAVAKAFSCAKVLISADDEALGQVPALVFAADWRNADAVEPELAGGEHLPIVLSLSSGTTGRPTGALVSHRQLYERFISQWVGMGFNASDRYLLATPLYFGGGRSFAMSMLAAGGTVIMRSAPMKSDEIVATVSARQVTAIFLVPTQIGRLLEFWDGEGIAFPSIQRLITSGAAMQPADRQRVMERLTGRLYDYYATSEGGGIALLLPQEQLSHAATVGRPSFRVEIQVVDADDRPVAPGEVGRLRYRGPGVSSSLIDNEGRITQGDSQGWFAPGDLGRITESGYVQLVGRIKDVIIRGGVNIYPAEIETVLCDHEAVLEASVFGVADRDLGEIVAAVVVPRPDVLVDADVLRQHVKERLAPYKTPQRIAFVKALPRNTSGKVVRAELPPLLDNAPKAV